MSPAPTTLLSLLPSSNSIYISPSPSVSNDLDRLHYFAASRSHLKTGQNPDLSPTPMTLPQRSIKQLEAYLSSPLTFSTFHAWSSPAPLHRAADLYFSTASANGARLPDWTGSAFRDYFVAASLGEQLAVHDILNLERRDREREVEEEFWISSGQVRRIEKWFDSAKVDGESFGRVLLQLGKEEIRTLLARVEELEGQLEIRVVKENDTVLKKRTGGLGADMVRGKIKRNKKRRKKQTGNRAITESLGTGTNYDDSVVICKAMGHSRLLSATNIKITVDAFKDATSTAADEKSDKVQSRREPALHDEFRLSTNQALISDVKVERRRSKRKRLRIDDESDVAHKRRMGKAQITEIVKGSENMHEDSDLMGCAGQGGVDKLLNLTEKGLLPAVCPELNKAVDCSCNTTSNHKEKCTTISKATIFPEGSNKNDAPDPLTPIKNSPPQTPRRQTRSQTSGSILLTPARNSPIKTLRRETRSQTKSSPKLLNTPTKRSPIKSPFFPTPTSLTNRSPAGTVSCIPFPPLSSTKFGLAQESLATNPFQLLIAVQFLNKTKGSVAMPVFRDLMTTYPTPELLAAAKIEDIVPRIRHLGLQNQRAVKIVSLAQKWLEAPPEKGKRYRTLHYPFLGAGKEIKPAEVVDDDDVRQGAWEVAHLPGVGDYAIDSWRIFCRDILRGVATGWLGEGAIVLRPKEVDILDKDGKLHNDNNHDTSLLFEPEWKCVLPHDKELRAYLRWLWLKEGWLWDPLTGKKTPASAEILEEAEKGDLTWRMKEEGLLVVGAGMDGRRIGGEVAVALDVGVGVEMDEKAMTIDENIEPETQPCIPVNPTAIPSTAVSTMLGKHHIETPTEIHAEPETYTKPNPAPLTAHLDLATVTPTQEDTTSNTSISMTAYVPISLSLSASNMDTSLAVAAAIAPRMEMMAPRRSNRIRRG